MKHWKLWSAISVLGFGAGFFLLGALDTSDNEWNGINTFLQEVNLKRGWKIGTTGYEMNSSGDLDVLTLDAAGAVTVATTLGVTGNVTLDDGSGASPNLTLTDGSDETAVFSKADSGNLSMTIGTTDSLQVLTGNLRVGNGTATVTLDGEDAYIEGTFEVDGAARFDGAVTAASTLGVTGASTLAAITTSGNIHQTGSTHTDLKDTTITGTTLLAGNLTFDGAGTRNVGTTTNYANQLNGKALIFPRVDVSLTSPSVVIATGGGSYVNVQTDGNQTGAYLTGGVIGQVVIVKSGSGSNTLRFDDGVSSMTLGANRTITEGQDDVLALLCTAADGDEWCQVSFSDN